MTSARTRRAFRAALVVVVVLVAGVAVSACGGGGAEQAAEPTLVPPQQGAKPGTYELVLFFATTDAQGLAAETRTAEVPAGGGVAKPSEANLAKTIVEELIKGPQGQNLFPTLPRSAKVRGTQLAADGTMDVDFSKELTDKMPTGETGEELAVYSVANSVAAVNNVKAVRFLVDGKPVDTLVGFVDLSEPVEPDLSLIVR